jgi:hypothetical protein
LVRTLRVLVEVRLLDGVLDQVEGGGGLRDARQERGLGEGQVREVLAPVALDRRRHPVAPIAVEVVVEVLLHDRPLPGFSGVGLGQADRLDDLLGLADVVALSERARGQQSRLHQLLRDRGTAALVALDGVDGGRHEPEGIEPGVVPERLVLDRRGRVHQLRGDVLEAHEIAAVVAEPRQHDLAAAVVDRRLLGEGEPVEGGLRVLEIPRQVCVCRDGGRGGPGAGEEQGGDQEHGEGGKRKGGGGAAPLPPPPTAARAAAAQPALPLPPGEAGSHCGRNDTMRGMDARFFPSGRIRDVPGRQPVTP